MTLLTYIMNIKCMKKEIRQKGEEAQKSKNLSNLGAIVQSRV